MALSKSKHIYLIIFILFCMAGTNFTIGQNNSLVLNGAFITLNNGTYSNPAYLVVNSGQPSAILRNSGHIISESEGNFVKWITSDVTSTTDYTIPFGYSNSDYLPVIIHKTSVGSGAGHTDNASPIVISTWGTPSNNMAWANSVTSMTGPSGADEFNSVIDRWWQVLAGTNVSATFDVTYRGSENTTASANGIFNGQQFDIPTDQWYSAAGSGTGVTSGTGTVSNINLLTHGLNTSSPYVLSSTDSPLPVELTSFTGICNENKIQINWATASEMNVSTIELQKSYDLNSWTTIYVATPSNKNTETNYSFSYNETNNAAVYYRLQTNDIDGKTELSETIYVLPCDAKSEFLTAYSETNIIHVHSHFKNDALVNYSLYDIQGKLIATGKYNAVSGDMFFSIPLEQISSAIYIFRAESSTTMCNQKLLIKTL